jgi:hypothetical protein
MRGAPNKLVPLFYTALDGTSRILEIAACFVEIVQNELEKEGSNHIVLDLHN